MYDINIKEKKNWETPSNKHYYNFEMHTGFGAKWKWDRASNFKHNFLKRVLA